jgi:hypothetical protein
MPKSPGAGQRRTSEKLMHGDWLSPQLERVLQQVFRRFDSDGDGKLGMDELQAFAQACNGGEQGLEDDEIEQVQSYFETDAEGRLTEAGFFQMCWMQTESRPADMWKDLEALGYDATLRLLPAVGEPCASSSPAQPAEAAAVPCAGQGGSDRHNGDGIQEAAQEAAQVRRRKKNRDKKLKQKAKKAEAKARDTREQPVDVGNTTTTAALAGAAAAVEEEEEEEEAVDLTAAVDAAARAAMEMRATPGLLLRSGDPSGGERAQRSWAAAGIEARLATAAEPPPHRPAAAAAGVEERGEEETEVADQLLPAVALSSARRVAAGQTWCLGEGVVLGCWDTRELAHDIRAMLAYRGVVYEDRRYQVKAFLCNRRCTVPMTTCTWRWMEGSHADRAARQVGGPPHYDQSQWTDEKEDLGLPFPTLPYLLVPGQQLRIAQHPTILRYLGSQVRTIAIVICCVICRLQRAIRPSPVAACICSAPCTLRHCCTS